MNNLFIQEIAKILLKPINSDNKCDYLISQFVSDIFRNMGYKGIIYPSTQSKGINIVSFFPKDFMVIPYSEKMYKVTKIEYSYEEIRDRYKSYYDYEHLLNSYNERENENKEKLFEYINEKINFEFECEIRKKLETIDFYSNYDAKQKGYNELVNQYSTRNLLVKFYRGDFYVENKKYSLAIKDYLSTRFIETKGVNFQNRIFKLIEILNRDSDIDTLKLLNNEVVIFINKYRLTNNASIKKI